MSGLKSLGRKVLDIRKKREGEYRREERFAGIVTEAVHEKTLARVMRIFSKPPVKRTDADIKVCLKFMRRNQFSLKFFRSQLRSQLQSLCANMTARVCRAGEKVYAQGSHAGHVYVVIEGRAGVYLPEDRQEASEYEEHTRRTRLLAMAGRLSRQQKTIQSELDKVKEQAGLQTASQLAKAAAGGGAAGGAGSGGAGTGAAAAPAGSGAGADGGGGGGGGGDDDHAGAGVASRWLDPDEDMLSDGEGDADLGAGTTEARATTTPVRRTRVPPPDPKARWQWALRRIVLSIRMGKALMSLGQQAREEDGKKWVQMQLLGKGQSFGGIDLYHPTRTRSASVWAKTSCILFMIPRDQYVALREVNDELGDLTDDVAYLSSLPWLHDATSEATVSLAYNAQKVAVHRGSVILSEGSEDNAIVCIKKGSVRVEVRGAAAVKDQTFGLGLPFQLGLLSPGQWFGEKPVLTGAPNDFTFVADTYSVLIIISARAFFPHRRRVASFMTRHLEMTTKHRIDRLKQLMVTVNAVTGDGGTPAGGKAGAGASEVPSAGGTPGAGAGAGTPKKTDSPEPVVVLTRRADTKVDAARRMFGAKGTSKPLEYRVKRPNAALPLANSTASFQALGTTPETSSPSPPPSRRVAQQSPPPISPARPAMRSMPASMPSASATPASSTFAWARPSTSSSLASLVSPIRLTRPVSPEAVAATTANPSLLGMCRPSEAFFSSHGSSRSVSSTPRSVSSLRSHNAAQVSTPPSSNKRSPLFRTVARRSPPPTGVGYVGHGRSPAARAGAAIAASSPASSSADQPRRTRSFHTLPVGSPPKKAHPVVWRSSRSSGTRPVVKPSIGDIRDLYAVRNPDPLDTM